ncbi:uncharacterized protein LOC111314475 isoform X2 [Durio zibethinus]|uniref:Uncharacterized protein LOC111314475 isoform X2 n=1 Tax=Durio zibethinus TaxID=66656 RepID=A0A6P6B3X2_DURZI|nr:uncharacterized protein LOC111314475 isoform X2 [Durio zibethinus]
MENNCSTTKRPSLKTHPRFNNYSFWKDKLRENCYKRVREDRSLLLWKMRLPAPQSLNQKDSIIAAFEDIVSDELKKIKDSSLTDCSESSNSFSKASDELWEYNGLQDAYQGECEEILLEMQRIFYEDHMTEPAGKEAEEPIVSWEDEEDEYLARAVYEHMQLNDEQIWCPICKQGELQQNHQLIYCTLCKLQLNRDDEVNLDILRDRLAEAHGDHFDRGCRLKPKFCLETRFGLTALYILCHDCGTFEVVI